MKKIVSLASVLLFFVIIGASASAEERNRGTSALSLTAGFPGLGIESDDRLLVALPIVNEGTIIAQNVKVTSAALASAPQISPKTFPVLLGDIAPKHDAVLEASFSVKKLKSGSRQLLVVQGTWTNKGTPAKFTLRKYITIPMRSGESAILRLASVISEFGVGTPHPASPAPGSAEESMNEEVGPPIPTGTRRGNLQPGGPQTKVVPGTLIDGKDKGLFDQMVPAAHAADDPVVFVRATQTAAATGTLPDASGASSNNVVLHSSNAGLRFSTNGGVSFTGNLSPPGNLNADGGIDGDHVIIYIPKIDRFVWLMQFSPINKTSGRNRYRVAVASPQQIIDSNGTSWMYFDMTSGLFGFGNDWMDYPDLAVGDNFLYFSANVVGANLGRLVGRIPLSNLKSGGLISIGFTGTPLPKPMSWASHLAQNITSTAYLAGHNGNSMVRVFSFPENSPGYSVHDVKIDSWPSDFNNLVSIAPNGANWVGCGCLPQMGIIGAARKPRTNCIGDKPAEVDELWLAWTAAKGGGFSQPHVQLIKIDASNYNKISQEQIWNDKIAFAYPALAVNSRKEVGVAIAVGGGGSHSNFGVSIYGDTNIYLPPALANASTQRYGDYFTVRRDWPNEGLFSAFGLYYTLINTSNSTCGTSKSPNCTANLSYIRFGRKSAVNNEPILEKCTKEELCKCNNAHDKCITDCEKKRDACMENKPGNPLPKECAQMFNECRRECDETLNLCRAKCQ